VEIKGKVGFVTGANRGLGRAFAQALLDAGAPKSRPEDIAARVIQALRGGSEEVLSDDTSRRAKLGLNATPPFYLDPDAWTAAIQNGGR
jgi:NAD(P)-dependent dehydrogenase (short-subunit alcohol dehydrogenase family)